MKVILTSFRESPRWNHPKYSIARWNPHDYKWMFRLDWLAPIDEKGTMRHLSPNEFRDRYNKLLESKAIRLNQFLDNLLAVNMSEVVFCCWCYLQRQPQYDKLYCHRILIGFWLEKNRPNVKVVYSDGAQNPIWER